MKRNDFATFIVYVAMFAVAICAGLFLIAPTIRNDNNLSTMESVLFVLLSVALGLLLNGVGLELIHILGGKMGHNKIVSVAILGLIFKKTNGKWKASLGSYEGLTGQTKYCPEDAEKSTLSAAIVLPMLAYLIEFIVGVILIIVFSGKAWVVILIQGILTVGGMIFIYNDFPARIDTETDGYRLVLLNKPVNRIAYNQLLIAENGVFPDGKRPETPVYDEITEFTARLNLLTVYRKELAGEYAEAIKILDKTIQAEKKPSGSAVEEAVAQKLGLLLLGSDSKAARKLYEEDMSDEQRKYVANLSSLSALRCYILVSAVLDESETETNYALERAASMLKKANEAEKEAETALLKASYARAASLHPGWELFADYLPAEPEKK